MEDDKDSKVSGEKKGWGGARPGAGRPKGSTDKITARVILEQAEQVIGKPFIVSLLEGYRDCVFDGDRRNRAVYEKMLLDKVASNLFDVEVTEDEDKVAAKQAVFAAAIAQILKEDHKTK